MSEECLSSDVYAEQAMLENPSIIYPDCKAELIYEIPHGFFFIFQNSPVFFITPQTPVIPLKGREKGNNVTL